MGCDQVPQVGKAANHRVQAIAGRGVVVSGYQANQWFVSIANQFVRELLGQVAGADNQRGAGGLQLLLVTPCLLYTSDAADE